MKRLSLITGLLFTSVWLNAAARGSGTRTSGSLGLYKPVTREEPGWLTGDDASINDDLDIVDSSVTAFINGSFFTTSSFTIRNQSTLQSGATAYPDFITVGSSATVNNLTVTGALNLPIGSTSYIGNTSSLENKVVHVTSMSTDSSVLTNRGTSSVCFGAGVNDCTRGPFHLKAGASQNAHLFLEAQGNNSAELVVDGANTFATWGFLTNRSDVHVKADNLCINKSSSNIYGSTSCKMIFEDSGWIGISTNAPYGYSFINSTMTGVYQVNSTTIGFKLNDRDALYITTSGVVNANSYISGYKRVDANTCERISGAYTSALSSSPTGIGESSAYATATLSALSATKACRVGLTGYARCDQNASADASATSLNVRSIGGTGRTAGYAFCSDAANGSDRRDYNDFTVVLDGDKKFQYLCLVETTVNDNHTCSADIQWYSECP